MERTMRRCSAVGTNLGLAIDLSPLTGAAEPLRSDRLETPAVSRQRCRLAAYLLPALHNHIHEFRVQLQPDAHSPGSLRRRQRRSAAQKWLIHQLSAPRM